MNPEVWFGYQVSTTMFRPNFAFSEVQSSHRLQISWTSKLPRNGVVHALRCGFDVGPKYHRKNIFYCLDLYLGYPCRLSIVFWIACHRIIAAQIQRKGKYWRSGAHLWRCFVYPSSPWCADVWGYLQNVVQDSCGVALLLGVSRSDVGPACHRPDGIFTALAYISVAHVVHPGFLGPCVVTLHMRVGGGRRLWGVVYASLRLCARIWGYI